MHIDGVEKIEWPLATGSSMFDVWLCRSPVTGFATLAMHHSPGSNKQSDDDWR